MIEDEPDISPANPLELDDLSLPRDADFEIWSPYDAADAAEALFALLNEEASEE